MANKMGVRRLGLTPCSEVDYKILRKREGFLKKGDKEGLKVFDAEIAAKRNKNSKPENDEGGKS